jgi:hypothetical protein
VAHALEQTYQGTQYKIDRWIGIRAVVQGKNEVPVEVRSLAFDLLGVPAELRSSGFVVPAAEDVAGLVNLADREFARLRDRQDEVLAARDDARRDDALAGNPPDDPETARFRRYELAIRRELHWLLGRLDLLHASGAATATPPTPPSPPPPADLPGPLDPGISGAGIIYQNRRACAAMLQDHDERMAAKGEAALGSTATAETPTTTPAGEAGPPPAVATDASDDGTIDATPAPPVVTPRPAAAAAPPNSHGGGKPLNRFEQAEANRQAR